MAQGFAVTVPVLTRDEAGAAVPTDVQIFNPNKISIWRDGAACPFEVAGAYRIRPGGAEGIDEDFFCVHNGKRLALSKDAYRPFFHRVAQTIRAHQPDWSLFAELDAFAHIAGRVFPNKMPERSVNASHWYDLGALYLKRFDPARHRDALSGSWEQGEAVIGARYRRQLADVAGAASQFEGGAPTMIGEFGIPYDLDEGASYAAWARGERDVWSAHEAALALMYDAMDALGLHSTQWNYTASNRNDLRVGDNWNQEDLSIFSRDQQDDCADPGAGGRAVRGFCRPYARRVQGRSVSSSFDRESCVYRIDLWADAMIGGSTEIYVPKAQYPNGIAIRVEGVPTDVVSDSQAQSVLVRACEAGRLSISIEPAGSAP
jgi:hypothetical protein